MVIILFDHWDLSSKGKLHYVGEVVEKEERMAVEYFKEAAYSNYTDGQYNYGVTLLKNEREKETAMKFINAAAMSGHTLAMFHLGIIYDLMGISNNVKAFYT